MKTLTDLRMELELGMIIYHANDPEMCVYQDTREDLQGGLIVSNFLFSYLPDGHTHSISGREIALNEGAIRPVTTEIGYEALDELIADWPIVSQPIWNTSKMPERMAHEEEKRRNLEEAQQKQYLDMMRGRIEGVWPYNLFGNKE